MIIKLFIAIFAFYGELVSSQQCGNSPVSLSQGNESIPAVRGEFPWLVRLGIFGMPMCGAAIINDQWLLSAAKCFFTRDSYLMFAGAVTAYISDQSIANNDEFEKVYAIDWIEIHPQYTEIHSDFDFALLHLYRPLQFNSNVQPICLIDDCSQEVAGGTLCFVSGWGSNRRFFDQTSQPRDELFKIPVSFIDRQVCKQSIESKGDTGYTLIGEDRSCAGHLQGGVDDCVGDAGGPLACIKDSDGNFYLHGIDSFGFGCNRTSGYWHVYSRPCHVMNWIKSVTESFGVTSFEENLNTSPSPALFTSGSPGFSPSFQETSTRLSPPASSTPSTTIVDRPSSPPFAYSTTTRIVSADPAVQSGVVQRSARLDFLSKNETMSASGIQCGMNKYNMMAAGLVPTPRPALNLEYPWQVRLAVSSFDSISPITCSGALIHQNWVLTSARCIQMAQEEGLNSITAHFGEYNLNQPNGNEYAVTVVNNTIHPNYDPNNYDYDFALLHLKESVEFSISARPICLINDCSDRPEDFEPAKCLTTGWNTIANPKRNPAYVPLEVAAVNTTDAQTCKATLDSDEYTDRKICAFGINNSGRPACQVDAGGPLICKLSTENAYFLHGIASYTQRGCSRQSTSVVYSRPCSVSSWIAFTVNGHSQPSL